MSTARKKTPLRDARGRFVAASLPSPQTPKKVAPKKAAPKKALPKKTPPKKVAPKKTPPKKVAPKKAPSKKAPSKKVAPKKVAPKKAPPKKVAPKKVAPKTPPKKAPPKKAPPKKVLPKKAPPKKAPPPPPPPPPPKVKKAKRRTMFEILSGNLIEARDRMRVGPASDFADYETRIAENSDDSIDAELRCAMTTALPAHANDVLLSLEDALRIPSSCWISIAFTVLFPPRVEPPLEPGEKRRKRGSPKWRKTRSVEDGKVEETTKVHWQRANLKAYHYVTARQMIRNIIARNALAVIRRIKVRVYWSRDGERPSRSR